MSSYQALPLSAQTLYAELSDQVGASGLTSPLSRNFGSFVKKTIQGHSYIYFQYREAGQTQKQIFLGPDNEATNALITRLQADHRNSAERAADLNRLASAFVAAGGYGLDHPAFRVLKAFSDAGILRPGMGQATIVGTYAFKLIGNVLGVSWESSMRTQDIDHAANHLSLAVIKPDFPVPDALEQLSMGFLPVPRLNPRHPSTSFKVRGKELRVDLLSSGEGDKPVMVPLFGSVAQPLRYMDFLLADTVPVAATSKKQAIIANVPEPVRFALHKLVIARSRPTAFADKANKDREQADAVLSACLDQDPEQVAGVLKDFHEAFPAELPRLMKSAQSLSVAEELEALVSEIDRQ